MKKIVLILIFAFSALSGYELKCPNNESKYLRTICSDTALKKQYEEETALELKLLSEVDATNKPTLYMDGINWAENAEKKCCQGTDKKFTKRCISESIASHVVFLNKVDNDKDWHDVNWTKKRN